MATATKRKPPAPARTSKDTFVQALAAYTGLHPVVVSAWANHEQGSSTVEGGNNWLNVETGGPGGGSGPHSPTAAYVERLGPVAAAKYTADWIAKNQPGILAAKGKGLAAEVGAIQSSGYAESHYGGQSPTSFLSAASSSSTKPHGESLLEKLDPTNVGSIGKDLSSIGKQAEGVGEFLTSGIPNPFKGAEGFFHFVEGFFAHPLRSFLSGVLLVVGALLVAYGVMVAVRPRDRAFSIPIPGVA